MANVKWHHLTATWNRRNKEAKIYLNSVLQSSRVSKLDNVDIYNSGQSHYQVGAINGAKFFRGYLTDLFALPYTLDPTEIEKLQSKSKKIRVH